MTMLPIRSEAWGAPRSQGWMTPEKPTRLSLRGRNHLDSAAFDRPQEHSALGGYDCPQIENWGDGVLAAFQTVRRTWPAILAIQFMIGVVIASYFLLPVVRPVFEGIIALRDSFGAMFGFVGMGVVVGGLSETLKVYTQQGGAWRKGNLRNMRFNIGFFGVFGIISYYKFIVYATLFGDGADPVTLLTKSFVDLVLYSAVFYNPVCSAILILRGLDYDFGRFRAEAMPPKGYACRVSLPTQLTHWALWVPMTPVIFLLPTPLQLPIVILGVTLWVILLSALNSNAKTK